jgi:hypothetical protein
MEILFRLFVIVFVFLLSDAGVLSTNRSRSKKSV